MGYRNLLIITVFTLTLLLLGLSKETTFVDKTGVVSSPIKHVVEIKDFKFYPEKLSVSIRDTIVWINKDVVPHTATASDKSWDTEIIYAEEKSRYVVIDKIGIKSYFCRYHPLMKGELMVTGKIE